MKTKEKKILIATGGTGGHIFPSLSLADFLKNKYQVEIITDKRGLKYLENYKKINIRIINTDTVFNRNIFKVFLGFIKIISSFIFSICSMIITRPKLIIGMGGYSSFPVCAAGYFLRIPVIIYENNLIIGRANKFILPLARKVLVSVKDIQGIKSKYSEKIFCSGFLIRSHILNLKKEKIQNEEKKSLSILIMGGSQSAKIFGVILPSIITRCFQNGIRLKIYQQCLDEQVSNIKKIYQKHNLEFELFSFSGDISKYYKLADFAITRSGASSIAELVNLRIPFIAIPLPSSADNHQFENANYFKNKGYCFLLEERFVSDKLFEILIDLNKDEKKLLLMKERMIEHSDRNTLLKIEKLIEKILNE
tara:strand:+ start:4715 stop:5806 length:1092 start_codon:yes stop_codon:yes gene_type:complete